jgi:hypothetical protein
MFFLSAKHFQPANPESLTSLKSPIRSLVVIVPKLKSQLSSFENLRGIVRPQKLSEVKSLSKPQSLSMSKKRTVPQRFFNTNLSIFSFSTMPANDRGYGHLAVCGLLHCRTTMMLMREMNFLIARQPASAHRRVLPAVLCLCLVVFVSKIVVGL